MGILLLDLKNLPIHMAEPRCCRPFLMCEEKEPHVTKQRHQLCEKRGARANITQNGNVREVEVLAQNSLQFSSSQNARNHSFITRGIIKRAEWVVFSHQHTF